MFILILIVIYFYVYLYLFSLYTEANTCYNIFVAVLHPGDVNAFFSFDFVK